MQNPLSHAKVGPVGVSSVSGVKLKLSKEGAEVALNGMLADLASKKRLLVCLVGEDQTPKPRASTAMDLVEARDGKPWMPRAIVFIPGAEPNWGLVRIEEAETADLDVKVSFTTMVSYLIPEGGITVHGDLSVRWE